MSRLLATAGTVAAALLLASGAVAATPPNSPAPVVQGSFEFTIESFGDTTLCGFPVDLTVHSKVKLSLLPDRTGPQLHERRHRDGQLHDQRQR
jgi:hypothetical protein